MRDVADQRFEKINSLDLVYVKYNPRLFVVGMSTQSKWKYRSLYFAVVRI
jgi:hypothetical protein